MTKTQILKELNNISALRSNRIRVADLILQNENNLLKLLELIFEVDNKTSIKAAWVFEFVCIKNLNWLFPHLSYFTNNISKVHFDSAVRPIAKICQLLVKKNKQLPLKIKEQIIETGFDWMISNHKVAIKAYTMHTLFILGKETGWVHKELKLIILNNIDTQSPAYQSRGKITLLQIKKFNNKNVKKIS